MTFILVPYLYLGSFLRLVLASAIPASVPMTPDLYSLGDLAPLSNPFKVPSYQSTWNFRDAAPPASFNELEEEFKNLTFKPPTCNGAAYGHNLQTESCEQALVAIPRDTRSYTFGKRQRGLSWNVNLPYRFLSRVLP